MSESSESQGLCRLFPLSGVVLFPQAVLPLHIFEPRYRQMTEDALADDRQIAIVQPSLEIASLTQEVDESSEPSLEQIACLGQILSHERLGDGRFRFLLVGRHRIRLIGEVETDALYRQAEYEILEEIDPEPDEEPMVRGRLVDLFHRALNQNTVIDPELLALLEGNVQLGILSDIVAQALQLPPQTKQALLAEPRVQNRAQTLIDLLQDHFEHEPRPVRKFPPDPSPN